MEFFGLRLALLAGALLIAATAPAAFAATQDLGNGFFHHGVATPISNHRGTVATADGDGRDMVLVWLFDHRGGYALLAVDAETGKSQEYPAPFPPGGDCPYSSLLSTGDCYYTLFNSHFCEFDARKRAFTFVHQTAPQMAMSMTEDDNGVIWAATYPQSGVVSFNPKTREFKDYGHVYKQNWSQYPRSIAVDDAGWVYFAIGNTATQIVMMDPKTGQGTPVLPEEERVKGGMATLTRDVDGKVYGNASGGRQDGWYELHAGQAKKIGRHSGREKPVITGSQGLFYRNFPDGKVLRSCDLAARTLTVEDPKTKQVKQVSFDYASEGAHIMGVAAAPDGTICGGTAFPMCSFSFDPRADKWVNRPCYGQWNTIARQGDRFFAGGYTEGFLLEWDPAKPWVPTVKEKPGNPLFLTDCSPDVYRPACLLAHPDGKTLVMSGTPAYGYTGGGLLFWDRETRTRVLLKHTDIIPELSTMSLAALPGGKLLGGTTTSPGTGGEKKAAQAELYILDMATKKVEWHEPVFPGAQSYVDLCPAPDGRIYGIADYRRFFVFDPAARKVVHEEVFGDTLGNCSGGQGPRVFITAPDKTTYVILQKGIAKVDPATLSLKMVAESPVPIAVGGDLLDGRIYFAGGSHLYSYKLP